MLAKVSSCRGVAARSISVVQRQLQAYQPARVLQGGGSLRVSLLVCCAAANLGSSDEETPKWAKQLFAEVQKATAEAQKATAEAQKATAEAKKTQDMVGVVLEVAVRNVFSEMRVEGGGTILESMDDMLHFLLRCPIHLTVSQDPEFYRAMRAAITEKLLYKDTAFLNTVIVLLRKEGMEQEAGQVEAVLRNGTGMEAAPEGVHTVRRCLQAVQKGAKAKGLSYDVGQLLSYVGASSTQERAELLETTLFVRCTAAMLSGSYTGVLGVDAGADVGCEVDEAAGVLRLRVGETEYNPRAASPSLVGVSDGSNGGDIGAEEGPHNARSAFLSAAGTSTPRLLALWTRASEPACQQWTSLTPLCLACQTPRPRCSTRSEHMNPLPGAKCWTPQLTVMSAGGTPGHGPWNGHLNQFQPVSLGATGGAVGSSVNQDGRSSSLTVQQPCTASRDTGFS